MILLKQFHAPTRGMLATVAVLLAAGASACREPTTAPPTEGPHRGRPALPTDYRPSGQGGAGAVFVHLFEWTWSDIAAECESHLGPAGYSAVQVSPPQEHIVLDRGPWWERYQPVSYSIERSRSGTRAGFEAMVERCGAAGVGIYVDAVINHMTAGSGVGTNGTAYTKYEYPGLWGANDFHPPCTVTDYSDAANVQDCELLGLADLHTGLRHVRERIAGYLVELVGLGVIGFRIDAAKHIQPVELDSILDRVNERLAAAGLPLPYYFAEVIDHGGEAVSAGDYYGLAFGSGGAADITVFRFRGVGEKFLGSGDQRVAELAGFSAGSWGLMPSDKAVVFLQNHDTQRQGGLGYRDGHLYRLAHVWMLAQPYGHPKVMSSYAFDMSPTGRDAGPPRDAGGATRPVTCAASMQAAAPGDWVCEHRDSAIVGMVGFRRAVAGTGIDEPWDNGGHAIAFSRGERGFVAINREPAPVDIDLPTPIPPGAYCDVLTGGVAGGACTGRAVAVDGDGRLRLELAPLTAVAIHVEARP